MNACAALEYSFIIIIIIASRIRERQSLVLFLGSHLVPCFGAELLLHSSASELGAWESPGRCAERRDCFALYRTPTQPDISRVLAAHAQLGASAQVARETAAAEE